MRPITLNTFRKLGAAEEQMIRSVMPRTSAADPAPLVPAFAADRPAARRWTGGRLLAPLTYTLQEVARG